MKTMLVLLAAMLSALLLGCAELKEKDVIIEGDGVGIKASTVADVSSGTPAPSVWLGMFNLLFLDHPKDAPELVYYKQTSATFNAEAKTTTYVYIGSGVKGSVTVPPNTVIDLPGLKVVSGSNTVNISADTTVDSGTK